ncbi:MAG TPA: heme exporter protein CcmB [Aestuariivirgaceae bacterium]|nr:heme exporter protein CcmB [Aestuariivirgaceae bacterium]
MKAVSALIRRDLGVAMRQGSSLGTAIGFFLTVVMLLPIGLGPDQALLQRIAPGALWIALLLSVLLSADRIFLDDYEDGSLELLASGPISFELVTLTKACVHWLTAGLPLAVIAPILGFLVNIGPDQVLPLAAAMIIGSLGISLLAALGAAVTVGLRRGGMMVSLLILPLYVPLMIFGVAASTPQTIMAGSAASSLMILAALSLAALVMVPIAASAALRAYMQ